MIKEQIFKAYEFAKMKHFGQIRRFTELEYFTHPKYVARIVEQLTKNEKLIIVALLHDTVEDTKTSFEEIGSEFGWDISDLVKELTNIKFEIKSQGKVEYMKHKMKSMSSDALTVKLADRYHNVLFLEGDNVPIDFIKKYYKETKAILEVVYKRELNNVQYALLKRIDSVLEFLNIRYEFGD